MKTIIPEGLKAMIKDYKTKADATDDAELAYTQARREREKSREKVLAAIIEAMGWHVGAVVTTEAGSEYKLAAVFLRLNQVYAICHDRLKTGEWAKSPRVSLTLIKQL